MFCQDHGMVSYLGGTRPVGSQWLKRDLCLSKKHGINTVCISHRPNGRIRYTDVHCPFPHHGISDIMGIYAIVSKNLSLGFPCLSSFFSGHPKVPKFSGVSSSRHPNQFPRICKAPWRYGDPEPQGYAIDGCFLFKRLILKKWIIEKHADVIRF